MPHSFDIWSLLLGGVIGYGVQEAVTRCRQGVAVLRTRRRWRKVNKAIGWWKDLVPGLQIAQSGWDNGRFAEDHVQILVDADYSLPEPLASDIREARRSEWDLQKMEDKIQIGLASLDPHRISDEPSEQQHVLSIGAKRIRYYDFLASNRVLLDGSEPERAKVEHFIGQRHYLHPVTEFANPLSIMLSGYCEGGRYLLLTTRTDLPSSGGTYSPGTVFNAVGEMLNPRDACASDGDVIRVSPWLTAERGLHEEMGWRHTHVRDAEIVFHSLIWDERILDYKLAGYVESPMSRALAEERWVRAPDRHENLSIRFIEAGNRTACRRVVQKITRHYDEWSCEALITTLLSFLHSGRLDTKDFYELWGSRNDTPA